MPFFHASFSLRVINAGKSMLNEDQASCEKLFVKKPSSKHRNSTLLEDNGVSEGQQNIRAGVSEGRNVWSDVNGSSNKQFVIIFLTSVSSKSPKVV